MEQRHIGGNAVFQQFIYKIAVKLQTFFVDSACAVRQNARPGDGKAVGFQPQLPHERNVLFPPVVVVTGHLTSLPAENSTGLAAEYIPDRIGLPILVPGPLDLIGRSASSPDEIFRKFKLLHIVTSELCPCRRRP